MNLDLESFMRCSWVKLSGRRVKPAKIVSHYRLVKLVDQQIPHAEMELSAEGIHIMWQCFYDWKTMLQLEFHIQNNNKLRT